MKHGENVVSDDMEQDSVASQIAATSEDSRLSSAGRQTGVAERLSSKELKTLFRISTILGQPGTFEDRVTRALDELVGLVPADLATLRVYDEKAEVMRLVAAAGPHAQLSYDRPTVPYHGTLSGDALTQGQPIMVNDYRSDPKALPIFLDQGWQSAVFLPIKGSGKSLGVVYVGSVKVGYFTRRRLNLLMSVADGLVALLENAMLREAERLRTMELHSLLNMASILSGPSDFDTKLKTLLEELTQIVKADAVALRVVNEKDESLRLLASVGARQFVEPPEIPGTGRLMLETACAGEHIVVNDYANHPRAIPHFVEQGLRSVIFLPIKAGSCTLGVVAVNSREVNHFPADRVMLLAGIANGMAILLENSGLLQQVYQAKQNLQETEAQYKAVVENSTDAIVIVVGGKRLFLNKAFLDIYGLDDMSHAIGSTLDQFILPEDKQAVKERIDRAVSGQVLRQLEFRICRPDGQVRTLQSSCAPITYDGQSGNMAIIRDVTERKENEEAWQDTSRRLEEALLELKGKRRSSELTQREIEVLELLSQGLRNREIASRLSISHRTVEAHVGAMMAKLGVQSRTEAIIKALRSEMIESGTSRT